jgi:hypothetical protein
MPEWSQEQKEKIVKALMERGAQSPCPRCGNPNFTLLDGFFNQPIQPELGNIILGGPSIPSVVTVCTHCGFISQHALGALGLLPKEGKQ